MANSTIETYVNGNVNFTIGEETNDISSMIIDINTLTSLPHVYYMTDTIIYDNAGSQMFTYWNDNIDSNGGILLGSSANPAGTYVFVHHGPLRSFVMFVRKDAGVEFMHLNPKAQNDQYTNQIWRHVVFQQGNVYMTDSSLRDNGKMELYLGKSTTSNLCSVIGYSNNVVKEQSYAYFCIFSGIQLHMYNDRAELTGNLNVLGKVTSNGSNTITHYAPIAEDTNIHDYRIGEPVFMTGHVYTRVCIDGEKYEWKPSTVNDSTDCICSVKPSGSWKEFVGIVTSINYDEQCLKFATHGDYIFHVTDSSKYEIGDMICYDGSVINDDTVITSKLMRTIIGIVTAIIDGEHIAVFKE